MNKFVVFFCAAAALLLSCDRKDVVNETERDRTITFTAGWADPAATTTILQQDGTSIRWDADEQINVFFGDKASGKFTSTNTQPQTIVDFQGSLPNVAGSAETDNPARSFWAVYPYNEANTCDGESVTLTIPSIQTAAEGTIDNKVFPAIATSTNFHLAFYYVCGGVRFSVVNEGIISVTFTSNDDVPLVGKVKVGFDAGKPIVKSLSDGINEVTVKSPEGGFIPGEYYFVSLVPQTLANGMTMTYKTEDNKVVSVSLNQSITTINRSRFENIVWTDGIIDISNLDVANYALLAETYQNKVWNTSGDLVDDGLQERNATSLVMIDKEKDIIPGTEGYADVVFFGENQNYISTVQTYIYSPINKADIPDNAVYMAFNYFRDSCTAEDGNFYVSTRPYQIRLTKKLYATQNRVKGTRPKILINLADSQETIFKKLVDAFYIEDCDVFFETGTYTFDSLYYLMYSKYGWADAFELPVGGNCRYYFNNSQLIGSYCSQTPSSGLWVESNSSIVGTHRLDGQTFELYDGELVADGLVYCVHDEASGGPESYVHKYANMIMRYDSGTYTQSGSKCIGGGTGLAGQVTINDCKFYNNHINEDISWHGHSHDTTSVFKLFVSRCFFSNGIGLHPLAAHETGYLYLAESQIQTVPSGPGWIVYSSNEPIEEEVSQL